MYILTSVKLVTKRFIIITRGIIWFFNDRIVIFLKLGDRNQKHFFVYHFSISKLFLIYI